MFGLPRIPWEEIIERKVELRRVKPHSKALEYISICSFEEDKGTIAYCNFANDPFSRESFERYVGFSLGYLAKGVSNSSIMRRYNEALKREIRQEKWFQHPCKSRIN